MTNTEILQEIIEFSGHKFVVRLDGQQIVALLATIELACRHPAFHGPTRVLAENIGASLQRIARQAAPALDLLEGVCHLGWAQQTNPHSPVDPAQPVCHGV